MAKSIMIQGTMSNVGKSILVGGLCRVFQQDGYKVAPFKSQNMALNSYITGDGLEMGRAQVMQAEAAGIEPTVHMNPILLKPTNDTGSQVIVNGEVTGVMSATEYWKRKKDYIPTIMNAYKQLDDQYDIIVIEGAGSPAEINLKSEDIVNMGMAKLANAPVLLVGDIDRGGVFAQIVGTLELLEPEERERIKGTIINKFRGDRTILEPGIDMLEQRTRVKVQGVIPYFYLDIDDEDSLSERFIKKNTKGLVEIGIIKLPRISNFTDFNPFEYMEEVSVRYITAAGEFGNPDMVILPGTKNTMEDLLWLRQSGIEAKILQHAQKEGPIIGICGGYQMLGQSIYDPQEIEYQGTLKGMGLLPIHTTFYPEKTRTRVHGAIRKIGGIFESLHGIEIEGYEIHMGISEAQTGSKIFTGLEEQRADGMNVWKTDGTAYGNVYGTYVHGIFDNSKVVQEIVTALLEKKGYPIEDVKALDIKAYKEIQYNELAKVIREHLNMEHIYRILEMGMD
ncbi:cobyric acid synthase [Lachnospiraceae bacterium LCP25S3_G4]